MPKAIVLGAGLVGSVMAAHVAEDRTFEVSVADVRREALRAAEARSKRKITPLHADLSDPAVVRRTVAPFDIVLGALSSRIGFQTLQAVIEEGKNFCDISYMAEDFLDLDDSARARGVTAVVDCGVAPGLTNMMAGYGVTQLDECESIELYVGGLPREPRWPFYYKAAFSPADVLEEYTRPVRLVEDGRVVVREALSEPETVEFPGIGALEGINTDGLRSLVRTLDVPEIREKTLRHPGHVELMRIFRETGLFGQDPITVGNVAVRPLDVTAALLFPKWAYEETEEDLTALRAIVTGRKDGVRTRLTWEMVDSYDRATGTSSMARTTAFPCAIVARLIAAGEIERPGVVPPELIAQQPGVIDRVLRELEALGVRVEARRERL
ncbi:MAG: saccharopine dehydrogenase family protein [Planctomycetota bacterium]|jgi:saccharopine dehydrogenase-like NADP-dependent oxidoreductase